jgi:hypothetical protein
MRPLWTALVWLLAAATLAGAGGYVMVYLVRWEWHRAILVALLFLAVQIAATSALVLRAVTRSARSAPGEPGADDGCLLEHIQRARPTRDHFAWLRSRDGAPVFIPVLLGAGVLVSAVAFLVERLAAATGGRAMERGLARDLASVAFPTGGLVADEGELAAQEAPYADDPELRVLLAPLHRGG